MNDNYSSHFGRRGNEIQQRLTYRDCNIINFTNQAKLQPSAYQEPAKTEQKQYRCQSVNDKTNYSFIPQQKPMNNIKPDAYESQKQKITQNSKNLVNIQSTKYDIINNTQRMDQNIFKEKHALQTNFLKNQTISKIVDDNRSFNPNYREDVKQKTQNNFYNKKSGFFSSECELQKSYGVQQRFRKYK